MRITLDFANDVLQAAKERARRERITTGEVISELARSALTSPRVRSKARAHKVVCGLRPFGSRDAVVTNELINKLREEDVY